MFKFYFILTLTFLFYCKVSSQNKIIFSRSPGRINTGKTLDLMIFDTKTMETKLLLKGSINRRGEYGAITSPDNLKIIFNTYRFSGWKLGIGDFDGKNISNIKKLTNRKNYEYCAQYSPDGSKIAYVEYDWSVRESDIYIADKNGKNGKYFFKTGISDQNIDWTRDSESIVFTLKKNKSLSIYIKSLNGGKAKKIVSHLANDFAPSTSKLEDKIAFLSDKEGKIHLFVVNVDGSNMKNLTPTLESSDGDENGIWPYKTSWSPDGKKIVFNVIINGDLEIFIVNSDGTELTQITNNNDTDMTPYWLN